MMKWIFGVLILVNAVFFAVMQWGSALTSDNTPPAQAALNADKIKIVSNIAVSSPMPASTVAVALAVSSVVNAPSSAVVPPFASAPASAQLSCMEWGEFSGADLQRAEKTLAELKLADKAKQHTVEAISGYWVYIPPMQNQAQIKMKVEQLKKFNVEDYFVMKEAGVWKNSISLGLFKTKESAKNYLAKLQEQGVKSAKIGPRTTKLKFTVFVLSQLDSGNASKLASLRKDFPDSELKQVPCN